jgi:hypothetical protein
LEAGPQGLQQEVRRGGQVRDLLQHGAGDPEVQHRRGRRRHLLPHDRLRPEARGRQAHPAAQPRLPPEHHQPVAGDAGSLLRQGLAVLAAVHDLPHRYGVADRHRAGGAGGAGGERQPVRDLLERGLREQGRDLRRLPRGALPRDVSRSPRRDGSEHGRRGSDQRREGSSDRAQRPRRREDDDRRSLRGRARREVRPAPVVVGRHPGRPLVHERAQERGTAPSLLLAGP